MAVTFELPMPVSVNMAFRNLTGHGRVRSTSYKKWAKEAELMLMAQRVKPFPSPVSITIKIVPQNKRAFDLDNRIKVVLDLLKTHGIITDDDNRYVKRVTVEEAISGPPCTVTLEHYETH